MIRPKFKTGNHLIMACGRLVLSLTKSYYITVQSKIDANINIRKVFIETQKAKFDRSMCKCTVATFVSKCVLEKKRVHG